MIFESMLNGLTYFFLLFVLLNDFYYLIDSFEFVTSSEFMIFMYECFDRTDNDWSNVFLELGDFDIEYIKAEFVLLRPLVCLLPLRYGKIFWLVSP